MTNRDAARPPAGRRGGSFVRTVLVGAAAAAVAVVAVNAVWAVQDADPSTPSTLVDLSARSARSARSADGTVELAGADVAPLVVPLTLVALACWGAVLVLRRRGRRVVAVLGATAGLGAAVVTVTRVVGADDLDPTVWPWLDAAAAAVTGLAMVRAWAAAPGWPEMSSRYERGGDRGPARDGEAPPQAPADLWRALDEGRDPTA